VSDIECGMFYYCYAECRGALMGPVKIFENDVIKLYSMAQFLTHWLDLHVRVI
jgi:hypothetical protein